LEVLAPGEERIQIRFFGNIANLALKRRQVTINAAAVEDDLALTRLNEADHHLYRGALPGTVGTNVSKNLARPERKADIVDSRDSVITFR
jgi:hypothetical protein